MLCTHWGPLKKMKIKRKYGWDIFLKICKFSSMLCIFENLISILVRANIFAIFTKDIAH